MLCGSQTRVMNSRHQRRSNQVWRRRQCQACGTVFTTREQADYRTMWRVRGIRGRLEPFSEDKLMLSLYQSCRHRSEAVRDARALTDTIVAKLRSQVSDGVLDSQAIVRTAQVALNRFDRAASVAYQAFHA